MNRLPAWAEIGVLPVINLALALAVSGLVIWAVGENPFDAMLVMVRGAFGSDYAIGYTLYYATNFIFTGLAVSVAFHAMLFNIGGEGQAALGGLGVALACLAFDSVLPAVLMIPVAILFSAGFGAGWALIPGYLQAYRGSHIVITTIMFNFIAAGLLVPLLGGPLKREGQSSPQTREFAEDAWLPKAHEILDGVGIGMAKTPLNLAFVVAILACLFVWVLIWRTKFGYALRAMGHSEHAAEYAGVKVRRMTVIAMSISGALAGMMALNEIMGVQHKLVLNFTSGYGFTGIAVALMGRNHPVGIILASVLFGALFQGGSELDFEFTTITREMVLVIQGLIILFSGALALMLVPAMRRLVMRNG